MPKYLLADERGAKLYLMDTVELEDILAHHGICLPYISLNESECVKNKNISLANKEDKCYLRFHQLARQAVFHSHAIINIRLTKH